MCFAFSFQVVRVYHDGRTLVFFFQTSLGSELESRTANCWFRSTFHAVSFAADITTATDFSAAAADIFTATDFSAAAADILKHRY